jgi:hypothetical protein
MVGDRRGGQPAERRQVSLIPSDFWWSLWRRLGRKNTVLLTVRLEYSRDRGQIWIILRMSGRTHLKVGATNCPERSDTAARPPLLQSTCGAHMSSNRDSWISPFLQPDGEVTQDRAEQSQG